MKTIKVEVDDVTYLQLQDRAGGAPGAINAIITAALRDWLDRLTDLEKERRATALVIRAHKRRTADEDDEDGAEASDPDDDDADEPQTGLVPTRRTAPSAPAPVAWHAPTCTGNRWQVRGSPKADDVDYIRMLALHVTDGWIFIQRQQTVVLAWAEHDATVQKLMAPGYTPNPWVRVWRVQGTRVEPWEGPSR